MIHNRINAAQVSKEEVEPAVRENALHQANEMRRKIDAPVTQIEFDGPQ